MAIGSFTDLFNSVRSFIWSDETKNEADASLNPVKKTFNDTGAGEPVLHKIVYPPEAVETQEAVKTQEEPLQTQEEPIKIQEAVKTPKEPLQETFSAQSKKADLPVTEEPKKEPEQELQQKPPPKEFSPLDIIAKFFADNNVSGKANEALDSAVKGGDWAKKDLWYFINNKLVTNNNLESVPISKELWQAGFGLLQEAAADGNKQAITDLAYVKFHGIGGVQADPKDALEGMKEAGFATKDAAFERWQPGHDKASGVEEPVAKAFKEVSEIKPVVIISNELSGEKPAAIINAKETETIPAVVIVEDPEGSKETPEERKLYDGSDEEQIGQMILANGFDPNNCMHVSVPDGGMVIGCGLKEALLKQGVSNPEECDVDVKFGSNDGKPSYTVTVPPESSTTLSFNP